MSKPEHAGYELSEKPIYQDSEITRYATDDPTVYVEFYDSLLGKTERILSNPNPDPDEPFGNAYEDAPALTAYLREFDLVREKLMMENLEFLVPEMIESDVEGNWAAFAIPAGFYTLREALKSFPDGKMNARDVAWMVKRVLIVLKATERYPLINLDNFLVNPEGHSIVLIGKYGSAPFNHVGEPLTRLHLLMDLIVKDGDLNGKQQVEFMKRSAESMTQAFNNRRTKTEKPSFDYSDVMREFSIKLEDIYGAPRYHQLELDTDLSKEFPGI